MDKSINIKDIIIKSILVIIIVVLLIHNCNLLKSIKSNENKKKSTGNVDVFEIKCDKDVCNNKHDIINNDDYPTINPNTSTTKVNNSYKDKLKTTSSSNNNSTEKDEVEASTNDSNNQNNEEKEELLILDDNIVWGSTNNLRIFSNPVYSMDQKIAPESSNTYQFVIKNNTNLKIKYSIRFIEKNDYNINMMYKLRKNNNYIIDTYSNYSNLNMNNIEIEPHSSDTYYLDWKWFGTSNDNSNAGITNAYSLSIEIEAVSLNE